MNSHTYYNDIIGRIRIKEEDGAIVEIEFANGDGNIETNADAVESGNDVNVELLDRAYRELDEYLRGQRREFTFPMRIKGTDFQVKVWKALLAIPYGETRTYGDIAKTIGNPKALRAVGNANNKNRLPIAIPCHRVVGANGSLVGYAGGLDIKRKLLEIESIHGGKYEEINIGR